VLQLGKDEDPDVVRIIESTVIVEFVADLFEKKALREEDLVKRALGRYYVGSLILDWGAA